MDKKILVLAVLIVVCAFTGGMLLNRGAPKIGEPGETGDSVGNLPSLPSGETEVSGMPLEEPQDNWTDGGLTDIFADSNAIEPPPIPP